MVRKFRFKPNLSFQEIVPGLLSSLRDGAVNVKMSHLQLLLLAATLLHSTPAAMRLRLYLAASPFQMELGLIMLSRALGKTPSMVAILCWIFQPTK